MDHIHKKLIIITRYQRWCSAHGSAPFHMQLQKYLNLGFSPKKRKKRKNCFLNAVGMKWINKFRKLKHTQITLIYKSTSISPWSHYWGRWAHYSHLTDYTYYHNSKFHKRQRHNITVHNKQMGNLKGQGNPWHLIILQEIKQPTNIPYDNIQ